MAKRGASAKLWRRSIIILLVILIAGFGTVSARLLTLQTVQAEDLQKRAVNQQLADTTISAKRGSIYDASGQVLAQSVSVWHIVLAPIYFKTDVQREYVAKGLSEILEVDYENLLEKTKQKSYYVSVKRKVSTETREKVLEFINKGKKDENINLSGQVIDTLEDYQRYYTYDNFAADVLGFTGSDGQGLAGLEYQYDKYLTGTSGRLVTAKNAAGTEMPFQYEQKVDAVDGYDLILTIDSTIQSIMEKYVRQAIEENKVANRGCAIMMNVKTGAILGLACEGSFNPNEPFVIADEKLAKEIEAIKDEDERGEAEYAALSRQWRNKAVSDTYYPGSVFKMITASAVLSEGLIEEDTRFTCTGYYSPFEGAAALGCHNHSGHGTQNLEEALCNSCNPAFMQMGNMLGKTKFYQYYAAFGFSEKTGIDFPGESDDRFFDQDGIEGNMHPMDLAVASFGQNFAITPIQMITACAAIANGGELMQPYFVSQIVDSSGNVIKTTEPTVKRQVISEDVAKQICAMLEQNAIDGGATNGYVAGYRIGGKTGTSEKKIDENGNPCEDYIASFCGIAPADDPEIALLVYFDTPQGDSYYGSAVAGPCFRNIMSEVLPYLGVEKKYTETEIDKLDTVTGSYAGYSLEEAQTAVSNDGLKCVVVGGGEKVIAQNPAANSTIPKDGTVVLYTDKESTQERTTVPDFTGCTMSQANELAAANNLNLCISGSLQAEGIAYAKYQDIAAGESVEKYSVVTVVFNQDNQIQ